MSKLNNIFFDFDKAALKTSSYPELERVLEALKGNKVQKIEIAGHADSTGASDYNMKLSEKRARAVYDYLIKEWHFQRQIDY